MVTLPSKPPPLLNFLPNLIEYFRQDYLFELSFHDAKTTCLPNSTRQNSIPSKKHHVIQITVTHLHDIAITQSDINKLLY
ncbi:hypothetical protein SHLO109777_14375 [Shewanella loihica]